MLQRLMTSNRQRSKLSRRLYGKIVALGHRSLNVRDDPLGQRYEVNKHNLIVEGHTAHLTKVYIALIEALKNEGWNVQPGQFGSVTVVPTEMEATATIERVYKLPQDGMSCFCVYVG